MPVFHEYSWSVSIRDMSGLQMPEVAVSVLCPLLQESLKMTVTTSFGLRPICQNWPELHILLPLVLCQPCVGVVRKWVETLGDTVLGGTSQLGWAENQVDSSTPSEGLWWALWAEGSRLAHGCQKRVSEACLEA